MKNRGMGSVFQPTYTERAADGTKVTKVSATWRISYYLTESGIRSLFTLLIEEMRSGS
jgi:hypothetical protein